MTKIMEKSIPLFIIVFISFILLNVILAAVLNSVINIVIPGFGNNLSTMISAFIIGFLYIYIFKVKNFFSFSNAKLSCILIIPGVLFFLGNITDVNFAIPTSISSLVLIILDVITPGLCEEIFYRGILVSYLMKLFISAKNIYPILIISAWIFGFVHLLGVFVGASLSITIFQIFYAFAIGIFFVAIYMRTGNFWLPVIIHSIIDILAGCCGSSIMSAPLVFDFSTIITFITSIILIILGLYYVRTSKHDEILVIWDKKWAN